MSKAAIGEAQASRAGLAMLKQAPAERRMEFVKAVMTRALALYHGGEFDSAEVLLEAVETEPAVRPMVLHVRGVMALQRGEDERALDLLEEAIQLNPADAEAHANLGGLLLKHRQHPQALAAYAAALTVKPENAAAQLGLARALAALDLSDLAHDAFRDVLARAPDDVEAVVDCAVLLNDMGRTDRGRTDEAIALLRDALARHREHADLHMALFACLFARGDWAAAWPGYEWRLKDPDVSAQLLQTDRPRWQGEDLAGKTILLQSERAYGDILQFVRYAPMVKDRGGRVILRAPQALVPLMRTVAGVDEVFQTEDEAPPFDVHVPLMSLPLVFGTRADTVPASLPYIAPDPDLVARWRERLGAHSGLSVGLVWQGDPAHPDDWRRSMPLDRLRALNDCPGVRFVGLQVGPGQEQLTEFDDRIVDAGAQIDETSFADAAAIVANLDLVICVDSAIAHLAGAMGKPVWILLAKASDWRWPGDRTDTPWYPQARLFRQTRPGDWAEVVGRLRAELSSFAGAGVPPPSPGIADPLAASARKMAAPLRARDPVVSDALFVEACRQQGMGNIDRAKKLFEQVLSLDPGHVNTLCNLGALELSMGHGGRALTRLQTAVVLSPDLVPVRMVLGDALWDAQKIEQALAQYQKAIELAPASAAAHVAYATALRKLGDAGPAIGMERDAAERAIHEHYRKALDLAPDDDAVHAQYALALCELGDLDAAMVQFLAATKINQRQSAEFYEALGRACAARGNSQGAEISLRHALALDGQRLTAHCALGDLYLSQDRAADARASFRAVLAVDAANGAALRGIERAMERSTTLSGAS